jgi:putative transposase
MPTTGRPRNSELTLSDTERQQLTTLATSHTLPYSHVRRAQIILASAAGQTNTAIAARFGLTVQAVGHWRRRFHRYGLAGLSDAPRSGRPRTHDENRVAALLRTVLASKPRAATHWSVRAGAAQTGISKSPVQRYLALFGVQPHRTKAFTLSTDPLFVEKVRDIVGLYLNPPDPALVLCVDEKNQIQALERAQPVLPMGLGYVEGITHGYVRHGTTTLFAALDIQTGEVLTRCQRRHRHQEFLNFLAHIDASVPSALDVHLVLDNYATHKHSKVRAGLAARPRYHVHFTPTYASWLNQVERGFGHITQRAIRRGSFRTVRELVRRIEAFVTHYNASARPFAWTATSESILAKLERLLQAINRTRH